MDTTDDSTYRIATANRQRGSDMLASLTPHQWQTPSLCTGWTVREVAGHLVEPLETKIGTMGVLAALVRYRGSLDRMVDARARRSAARPTADLVARLHELAPVRLDPPVIGPLGPMTDSLIHVRDIARPLGLDVTAPPEDWRIALDFLTTPTTTTRNLAPPDRISGLRLVATDQNWQHGEGASVHGPSEALAMAITGRSAALTDLEGPGVSILKSRLLTPSRP